MTAAATTGRGRRRWSPTWGEPLALALVVMVPAIVTLIAVARPRWYPAGDMAQAELHLRGFWRHPPLVGAAGRILGDSGIQGSHPGPAPWVAMYPVYALFGRSSFGMLAGVASVHLASLSATLWFARRRGGRSLMVAVAGVMLLLVRASGPSFLIEPWNPWLAVIPFACFVVACWDVVEEHPQWLWMPVVAGSFVIQCHIGYALVVGGLLAVTVGWGAWRHRGGDRRTLVRGAVLAIGAGVLVWIPPLVDQWRRHPGNITLLRQQFLSPDEPFLSWSATRHVVALQYNAFGPWLGGPGTVRTSTIGLALFVLVWGGAVVVAARGGDRPALRLHGLLGAGVAFSVLSVKRIFGDYFEYTVRWAWVLSALVVAASGWTLWRAARPAVLAWASTRRVYEAVAAALGIAVVLVAIQVGARADQPGASDSRTLRGLAPLVVERLDKSPHYLLRWYDRTTLGANGFGLLLDLERHGFRVGAEFGFVAGVLPHRVVFEVDADGVLYLVVGRHIDDVRRQPGVDEVAYFDPRTPEQRQRSAVLLDEMSEYLDDPEVPVVGGPALPPEALAILVELNEIRQPAAVFLAAPGTVIEALEPGAPSG